MQDFGQISLGTTILIDFTNLYLKIKLIQFLKNLWEPFFKKGFQFFKFNNELKNDKTN